MNGRNTILILAGAGLFCAWSLTLHALEFTGIRVQPGPGHHTVLLTVSNNAGQVLRLSANYDNAVTTARVFHAQQSLVIPDRVDWFHSPAVTNLPWSSVPASNSGPVMVLVPFSPADKATADGNPALYPDGFGTYQKDGPEYSFFMSKFEVSNEEFARFLNDAQVHSNDTRGFFTFFDANGVVRFNLAGEGSGPPDYDMFDLFQSRLHYTPGAPVGERYGVAPGFERFPVVGVSWFGALKYCNWLTLDQGFGESERCYTEGFNPDDWHPVTAAGWPAFFTDAERSLWATNFAGYRLPMLHHSGGFASAFNEFYKAAAWTGAGNTFYAFGRDTISAADANYFGSGDPFESGLTPDGYYDGTLHGRFATAANGNRNGIYDLSGNANEWLNDTIDSSVLRAFRGGSYLNAIDQQNLFHKQAGLPRATMNHLGFRVVAGVVSKVGTNVNETIPLTINPTGRVDIITPFNLTFTALGGTGSNTWSVSDAALGSVSPTTGIQITYAAADIAGTQTVFLTDGIATVSTVVVQFTNDIPLP